MKGKFYLLKNMMWKIILLMSNNIFAQEYPNPFLEHKNEFNQEDIIIMYNEANTNNLVQRVFGYDWVEHYADQGSDLILPLMDPVDISSVDLGSGSYISMSAGRFNDDKMEDVAYIIERDSVIKVGMNTMNTQFVEADSSYNYELGQPGNFVSIPISAFSGAPRDAVGDFDGDGTDEIAIAYWQSSGDIVNIQILDSDNSETFQERASINDQVSLRVNGSNAFDISSADLNGDGADEIILMGLETSASANALYQVFVKVYEVNSIGSESMTAKASMVLDDAHLSNYPPDPNYQLAYAQTAISGLLTQPDSLESVAKDLFASFAYVYYGDPLFDYDNFFQYLIRSNEDLTSLSVVDSIVSFASSGVFQDKYPLEVKIGDLNGDRIEDAVLMTNGGKIYSVIDDSLMFKGNSGGVVLEVNNSGVTESVDRFELGDVDQDERDEIITFSKGIGDNTDNNFFISISGVLDDFSADTLTGGSFTFTDQSNSNQRSYAIAVGNLDGKDFHFGEPDVKQCEYVQPVFILSAIPNHFDIIDDLAYDVNSCYPEQNCEQEVTITTSTTNSTETQIGISSDWAVSSEGSVGAQASGISVGTTIKAKYGVKFDELTSSSSSQTLSVSITASSDDKLQYIQIPITVYQYPVIDDGSDTISYIIAAFPTTDFSPQSIVAAGKSVFNYTPNYEIGNILSYPSINSNYENVADLPNTAGNWIILDNNVPNYDMSSSGGISYFLNANEEISWDNSTDAYAAINTGISPLGFGIGLPENDNGTQYLDAEGLPTNYPPNAIDLHMLRMYSNSINNQTDFSITPSNIIGSPNEFNYTISPKIYWNRDGSGVVSFEVDINNNVGVGSFWSTAYNEKSDPALNLPYRYELYHNPNLSNTEILDRTKSLRFSQSLPQIEDTVSAFVKIFNYSFLTTGQNIEFELYYEDPDNGGTLIEDIDGNTLFETAIALGERGRMETEVRFVAFEDLVQDDFAKIYVLIDPNNLIDEVHEENNKGWAQFGYSCNQPGQVVGIEEVNSNQASTSFLNIYPIPANEQMTIKHDLSSLNAKGALVEIYNMIGKKVAQFEVSPFYEGKIYWNTRSVSPGIYIINLKTDMGVVESQKVIIAR